MGMNVQIPVGQLPDGSLTPCPLGPGFVEVIYNNDPLGARTAFIHFMGANQALVTFDDTGTRAVSYTVLNPLASAEVMTTIENIITHLASQPAF